MTNPASVRYLILLIDGSADDPIERIGGRTPLMAARIPTIDRLAAAGRLGTLETVPEGMPPGSAVANLSVLGYDPRRCYQGRGVLEAASLGVELGARDIALRCNLIALDAAERIADHSAGHISSEEAAALVEALHQPFAARGLELHPGVAYRHLAVLRGEGHSPALRCWPPHDHVGKPITALRITATAPEAEPTAALLEELSAASRTILAEHPINQARRRAGKRCADSAWFWSPGRKPEMESLAQRFGLRGAVISAVDLIAGLGRYAGMTPIAVEGATGLYDTNYEGKASAALEAFAEHELVMVHVEGPDEAGHARDLGLKIHALESIDRRLLAPLLEGMEKKGYQPVVAVLPDHYTPVERGDHVGRPVPVAIYDTARQPDAVERYDEQSAAAGSLGALRGDELMRTLLWRQQ